MAADNEVSHQPLVSTFVSIGKDTVAMLRDGMLFLLAVLLILFPGKLNSVLTDAGFTEGSLGGFKWQSSLVNSNQALKEAQAKISELQKINNEQVKALTEARALLSDTPLKQRISKLEAENSIQKESTEIVQNSVAQTLRTNAALVAKAQVPIDKSNLLVGLQTLGITDEERIAINGKLSADGYGLDKTTWSYPAGERPSWFAPRSTVFYYSSSALPAAQELARFMKSVTQQEFAVQRGAGLGVDPSRRDVTFFVHLVRK